MNDLRGCVTIHSHTLLAAYLAAYEGLDSYWARHSWHPSASTRPWTSLCGCVSRGIIISRHVGAKETFKDTRYVDGQATVFPSVSSFEIWSHQHIFSKKLEHNCVFHSVASALLLPTVQLRTFGDEGSWPNIGLLPPEIMLCVCLPGVLCSIKVFFI